MKVAYYIQLYVTSGPQVPPDQILERWPCGLAVSQVSKSHNALRDKPL